MRIIAIVQARMGSERLQGKVIKKILEKPMILHVLDRLKKSKYIDEVILATSVSYKEEPLVKIVEEQGFNVFRGSEDNVLERYVQCTQEFNGDIIVRVTGDCPLIDWNIVDNVITNYLINDIDYARLDVPQNFIRGFDVEVFSKETLLKTFNLVTEDKSENVKSFKEHVTLYIYNNLDKFNMNSVKGEQFYNKDYRLCVDTEEDFELISKIFNTFNDNYITAKEVVTYLDNNKDVAYLNRCIEQKKYMK